MKIRNWKNIAIFATAFAFAASFLPGILAAHADDTAATVTCGVTNGDIAAIAAIQSNPSLSYHDEVTQELALRQSLLAKTIGCAVSDATALKAQLASAPSSSVAAAQIQSQLSDDIDSAIAYYGLELAKSNSAGIAGTEQVARDMLAWRKSNYDPLAGTVANFIVWDQNQPLFDTATTRFTQIQRIVSFLTLSDNSDLATAFAGASASFQAAQSQNAAAQQALAEFLPPDQSLPLIQQSLASLATTYQDFFTISGIVQGINGSQ